MSRPTLSRRALLAVSVLGASGCTISDPTISGPRPTQLSPTPTPALPGATDAVTREEDVRRLALALGNRAAAEKDARGAARWRGVAEAHRVHAEVWASPDPTTRTAQASPSPQPSSEPTVRRADVAKTTSQLGRREGTIRSESLTRSLGASGVSALLWASTGAFAAAAPTLGRRGSIAAATPNPGAPTVGTEAEAATGLLRQVFAMIYGYQAAAGPLDYGSGDRRATLDRLTQLETLRADLTDALVSAKQDVPVAEPAYRLSVRPTDAASSAKLRREMEAALLPWVGGWVASTGDESTARRAGGQLATGTALVASLGGRVPVWPGFVD